MEKEHWPYPTGSPPIYAYPHPRHHVTGLIPVTHNNNNTVIEGFSKDEINVILLLLLFLFLVCVLMREVRR